MKLNLVFIVDIFSGTCYLIMAFVAYFSNTSSFKKDCHIINAKLLLILSLLIIGIISLTPILEDNDNNYALLKCGIQQCILSIEIFLYSLTLLQCIQLQQHIDKLMIFLFIYNLFILLANSLQYYIHNTTILQDLPYFILSSHFVLFIFYLFFFAKLLQQHRSLHPNQYSHVCQIIRTISTEPLIGYTMGFLLPFCNNSYIYLLYNLLCILFYLLLIARYDKYEAIILNNSLQEYHVFSKLTSPTIHTPLQDQIAEKLQQWTQEQRYRTPGITIKTIGTELGINRTYLSNYINEIYGTNFNSWINELRITEAKRLMQTSPDTPLSTIAELVGYADSAHFSKLFKKSTGMSPSIWKKELQKNG